MKKRKWPKIEFRKVDISKIDDRTLLANLYFTQLITFLFGIIIIMFQRDNRFVDAWITTAAFDVFLWGGGFAAAVLLTDWAVSRFVPEHVTDDGGINEKIFRFRPLWHIAFISLIVAICEEVLFRGALQHVMGPYWTSIVFAAIHIRYLRHWIMTGLVFSISYGLGWIYIQTGTIWTPIFAHFAIDFIMGCIIRYRRDDES